MAEEVVEMAEVVSVSKNEVEEAHDALSLLGWTFDLMTEAEIEKLPVKGEENSKDFGLSSNVQKTLLRMEKRKANAKDAEAKAKEAAKKPQQQQVAFDDSANSLLDSSNSFVQPFKRVSNKGPMYNPKDDGSATTKFIAIPNKKFSLFTWETTNIAFGVGLGGQFEATRPLFEFSDLDTFDVLKTCQSGFSSEVSIVEKHGYESHFKTWGISMSAHAETVAGAGSAAFKYTYSRQSASSYSSYSHRCVAKCPACYFNADSFLRRENVINKDFIEYAKAFVKKSTIDEKDIMQFWSVYGKFYVHSGYFGLQATATQTEEYSSKEAAMKDSAVVKAAFFGVFEGGVAGGQVVGGQNRENTEGESTEKISFSVQVVGGCTLVGNNPMSIADAIENNNSWRLIEIEELRPVYELLPNVEDKADPSLSFLRSLFMAKVCEFWPMEFNNFLGLHKYTGAVDETCFTPYGHGFHLFEDGSTVRVTYTKEGRLMAESSLICNPEIRHTSKTLGGSGGRKHETITLDGSSAIVTVQYNAENIVSMDIHQGSKSIRGGGTKNIKDKTTAVINGVWLKITAWIAGQCLCGIRIVDGDNKNHDFGNCKGDGSFVTPDNAVIKTVTLQGYSLLDSITVTMDVLPGGEVDPIGAFSKIPMMLGNPKNYVPNTKETSLQKHEEEEMKNIKLIFAHDTHVKNRWMKYLSVVHVTENEKEEAMCFAGTKPTDKNTLIHSSAIPLPIRDMHVWMGKNSLGDECISELSVTGADGKSYKTNDNVKGSPCYSSFPGEIIHKLVMFSGHNSVYGLGVDYTPRVPD